MEKNYFIKLTTNLYRLTLLFPKKEPLRNKMRALADEVLANCVLVVGDNPGQSKNLVLEIEKNLHILDSYFEVAKNQNWVSPHDVLEIQKEYSKIKEELGRQTTLDTLKEEIENYKSRTLIELRPPIEVGKKEKGDRLQKILEVLKEKGRVQVGELKTVFPQITKRTLRRDFESLLKQGLIVRRGEKNSTFYQLKRFLPAKKVGHTYI